MADAPTPSSQPSQPGQPAQPSPPPLQEPAEPEPRTPEEAMMVIQRHRAAMIRAQQAVLKRELTMPQYNEVAKKHLDRIHAMEAWLHDYQERAAGSGAGLY